VIGRATDQAASRRHPTAAARVRARKGHVEFVVDNLALGQVFSDYFILSCQSSFHQILHPNNHPGQVQLVADVPSGPSWTKKVVRDFLHGLSFDTEAGVSTFLQNVGELLPKYTASLPRL
jgi:hypothetical protein